MTAERSPIAKLRRELMQAITNETKARIKAVRIRRVLNEALRKQLTDMRRSDVEKLQDEIMDELAEADSHPIGAKIENRSWKDREVTPPVPEGWDLVGYAGHRYRALPNGTLRKVPHPSWKLRHFCGHQKLVAGIYLRDKAKRKKGLQCKRCDLAELGG